MAHLQAGWITPVIFEQQKQSHRLSQRDAKEALIHTLQIIMLCNLQKTCLRTHSMLLEIAFILSHFCAKPRQGKEGTIHKVLPAPTLQASQHHWDEPRPSPHQWKPVGVHLQAQAAAWQYSWLSTAEDDGPACNSFAPAPLSAESVPVPTS